MTTNRLARSEAETSGVIPPKGKSPEQRAARQRFWIEHGNESLRESGRGYLQWICVEGSYSIVPR